MELVQTCIIFWKDGENSFHYHRGSVKLVLDCFSDMKVQ